MDERKSVFICRCDLPERMIQTLKDKYNVEIWNEKRSVPRDILLSKIKGKHAILVTPSENVDEEFLKTSGEQLEVISTLSVGYDHINMDAVRRHKKRLGFTPNVLDDAVAELTMAIMLTATRRLFEGRSAMVTGEWCPWMSFFWLNGIGLKNSTVGIIGLGRIGLEVARRLIPFRVKQILYYNRKDNPAASEVQAKRVPMETLLQESDMVIVLCSLTPETKNLLGAKQFKMMKKTAILVNVSRGSVIDQDALIEALQQGTIGGAALDVMTPEPLPHDHPLLSTPNCCVVPHLGSAVVSTRIEMADLAIRNIICALEGQTMPAEVN